MLPRDTKLKPHQQISTGLTERSEEMARKCLKRNVTEEQIRDFDNVPVEIAAAFIGMGPASLRNAMQDHDCPFGFVSVRDSATTYCGERFTYNISPGLLIAYKNGTLQCMRTNDFMRMLKDAVEELKFQAEGETT